MTLNFETVRELLLDVEAAPGPYEVVSLNDAASRELFHSIDLLTQGGYLDSVDHSTTRQARKQMVLTLHGQDFLNAIRADETWALLKVRLPMESSCVPLHLVEQYAYQLARQAVAGAPMSQ